jgi:hypothetical protein
MSEKGEAENAENRAPEAWLCPRCGNAWTLHTRRRHSLGYEDGRGPQDVCPEPAISLPPIELEPRDAPRVYPRPGLTFHPNDPDPTPSSAETIPMTRFEVNVTGDLICTRCDACFEFIDWNSLASFDYPAFCPGCGRKNAAPGLPSARDLDAVAEEQNIAERTSAESFGE